MGSNIFGAVLAFGAGAVLAAASYVVSRYVLKKCASKYVAVQGGKQLVQVAFLLLLFLLGGYTPWDRVWLLAGGVLGITLPMFYFTYRLVKFNDSLHGKEETSDG